MQPTRYFAVATAISLAALPAAAQVPLPKPAPSQLTAAEEGRLLKLGHTYTRWLLEGKADSLAGAFDPNALEQMGGAGGVRDQVDKLAEHAGAETELVAEKMNRRKGLPQFWHEGNFSQFTAEPLVIRWLLDAESGKIVGAGMGPKSSTPAPDN